MCTTGIPRSRGASSGDASSDVAMRRHTLPEVATRRQKRREHGDEPPRQPARRADADQLTQEEPEIEAARVDQQSLADVRVAAQVHTAHPAGLVEVREGSFQALTAKPQQTQAACAANAPTIAVHRSARLRMVLPVPSSAIGCLHLDAAVPCGPRRRSGSRLAAVGKFDAVTHIAGCRSRFRLPIDMGEVYGSLVCRS
jgi:hypothetical protein